MHKCTEGQTTNANMSKVVSRLRLYRRAKDECTKGLKPNVQMDKRGTYRWAKEEYTDGQKTNVNMGRVGRRWRTPIPGKH